MNERLAADLGRWEEGELSADVLRERHPDGQPDDLLEMRARVSLATSVADEYPDLGWEDLEARLDLDLDAEAERDEDFVSRRRRVPVLKLVVAFVAGALVNPFQPADRAVDGLRAVARNTADVVVEEVTDVFEPMMPSRAGGVVVLDPADARNLSALTPDAPPDADAPAETPTPTSPAPMGPEPVSERAPEDARAKDEPAPSTPVETDPVEETDPVAEPGTPDEPASEEPAPEPDEPPTSPPGHQRRAERSPSNGGGSAPSAAPGHTRKPTGGPGRAERPPHAGVAETSPSASTEPGPAPPSKMAGGHRGNGDGADGRGKGPR